MNLQAVAGVQVSGYFANQISLLVTPEVANSSAVRSTCRQIQRSFMTRHSAVPVDTAQGSRAMLLDSIKANMPGLNGTGIKIGIMSDSYAATNANWHLFTDCQAVNQAIILAEGPDDEDLADEGRAMAELICYVAPAAQLYFYSAYLGEAAMAQGILQLAAVGCNIIVDDVQYFAESEYSPGPIAQAVDMVKAQGVAYFAAAGNSNGGAWEAAANWVVDQDSGKVLHNFGTAENPTTSLQLSVPRELDTDFYYFLQWNEPFFRNTAGVNGPTSDINLYLCPGPVITDECLTEYVDNNGDDCEVLPSDAFEFGGFSVPASDTTPTSIPVTVYIIIELADPSPADAGNGLRLKLSAFPETGLTIVPGQNGAKSTASALVPHSNTQGAMSVGAAYYRQTPGYGVTPAVLETYSSPGLQPVYYTHLGSLLPEPMLLQKPDIVAPDGTQTSFFYGQNSAGEFHFYGTSAAAPHAAAVAALMLQQNRTLTPDAIYTRMRSTALDMGAPGYDRFTGFGFINGKALLVSG
ncbi:hypothetical protein OEZ85_007138 [Tetradesmus obliquus]|uniref:Peptidase S8/S53 domain-containing protein n=1 Tax=Tetradesmus obliquus TaxID=3088 RepID=A0ABY8TWS1_TETOB|nr:hypothetical protein OEZ85_007138 [Tetradesmus obliquus]